MKIDNKRLDVSCEDKKHLTDKKSRREAEEFKKGKDEGVVGTQNGSTG